MHPQNEKKLLFIKKYVERELDVYDLSSRCRDNAHVIARTVYYYLAISNTSISKNAIAKYINRTHATVINALHPHNLNWALDSIPDYVINKFGYNEVRRGVNSKYFLNTNKTKYTKMDKLQFAEAYYAYRKRIEKKELEITND